MSVFQNYDSSRKFTGGSLITFNKGVNPSDQKKILSKLAGSASAIATTPIGMAASTQTHYDDLGLASLNSLNGVSYDGLSENEVYEAASSAADEFSEIAAIEPELWYFALNAYPSTPIADQPNHTWGLEATKAYSSHYDGTGINVAILDTGFDLGHSDFPTHHRNIVMQNFTSDSTALDINGHGTHCTGTAVGNSLNNNGTIVRYGVAPSANIRSAKVLNNGGSGQQRWIINGMKWAIDQGCEILSMSLGSRVWQGQGYSLQYERMAEYALQKGSLVIAAAGNDSQRDNGYISPVGSPANCPSIMAVAAIDQNLKVAEFSNGDINQSPGSAIDIAAPGVNIFSSWPRPRNYRRISGTSMACPHVAGVAALFAQKDNSFRGKKLWAEIVNNAIDMSPIPNRDVGAGLVQAP